MGLKSGSRDSGLDDEDSEESEATNSQESESDSLSSEFSEAASTVAETARDVANEVTDVAEESCEPPEDGSQDDETGSGSDGDEGGESDSESEDDEGGESESGSENDSNGDGTDHPDVGSIPYKLRRAQVNEGRQQVPYFLRPEVTDGEAELKQTLEDELSETVYKSDYREAAMIVAQRNPELVAEVLREWGYDLR